MEKLLELKKIKKIYHDINNETLAIDNLNLEVYEGEFIAIVGPSGCGKSTLLSIIFGLEKKSDGDIIIKKDELKMGYMLQRDSLFPWLTVMDNCLLGLKIKGKIKESDISRVKKLLKKYDLEEFINYYPKSLSGGMRQRVALIRTLACNPDLILLDEPFSALDYQTRLILSDDIYNIIKKEKKTTIMVTHDLSEAISMADRIIVLSHRPSTVKKEYTINLTNKSNPINNRKAPEFASYYNSIWKDLDIHV